MPSRSTRPLVLALAAPLMLGASCPRTSKDCEHDSVERCNWEQAVGTRTPTGQEGKNPNEEYGGDGDSATFDAEPDDLDDTLEGMIDIMHAGLEWALVDEQARGLCRVHDDNGRLVAAPVTAVDEQGVAREADAPPEAIERWRCHLPWLEINGQSLELEASNGVISLSAEALDVLASEELVSFARARFDDRCEGDFEEYQGAGLEEFYRCALPEGPYLVVARFPRDPEATLWQVSIAVVDAG